MPSFINKETGEEKVFSRIRVYINDDLTKRTIDLLTGKEIGPEWEPVDHRNYKKVAVKKAPKDGGGIR